MRVGSGRGKRGQTPASAASLAIPAAIRALEIVDPLGHRDVPGIVSLGRLGLFGRGLLNRLRLRLRCVSLARVWSLELGFLGVGRFGLNGAVAVRGRARSLALAVPAAARPAPRL